MARNVQGVGMERAWMCLAVFATLALDLYSGGVGDAAVSGGACEQRAAMGVVVVVLSPTS
jgi:hypothetical protein